MVRRQPHSLYTPRLKTIYYVLPKQVVQRPGAGTTNAFPLNMISQNAFMTSGGGTSFAGAEEDRPKILVVDDSPIMRDVIMLALRSGGHRARSAVSGDEARDLLAFEHPALLITDLNMPSGDGWKLIAYCRAYHPQLPILIVSGLYPGTRPEIESYADGYLVKPFGSDQLLAEVARLVPAETSLWRAG